MVDLNSLSKDLIEHLELRYAPVGITLFREGEQTPAEIPFCPDNLKSYCQALVLACEGRTLLMMGLPGSLLEPLHTHILNMAKPIAMLKNARPKKT